MAPPDLRDLAAELKTTNKALQELVVQQTQTNVHLETLMHQYEQCSSARQADHEVLVELRERERTVYQPTVERVRVMWKSYMGVGVLAALCMSALLAWVTGIAEAAFNAMKGAS